MITLVIDAMGGDLAPKAPVQAAIQAAREFGDTKIILTGDETKIRAVVPMDLPSNIEIRHTEVVIEATDEPVRAVRRKQDSSLVLAAQMVRDGAADVLVSAGNTGAIMASGMLVIGRMKGIERPALAPILPTFKGTGVLLLDAGATMDASAKNLYEYAQMANAYAKYVMGIASPRIGLLNVGTEERKGNSLTKETFDLLKKSTLNFVGNIEARDVLSGDCDAVVCDGFVGNVVLKLSEGLGAGLISTLKRAMFSSLRTKIGALLLKPALAEFRSQFDYGEHGGAPLLGINGGCLKAHGSSDVRAWYVALTQARKFVANELLKNLSHSMGIQAEVAEITPENVPTM
jgi:phosphate acyltransferase